MKFFSLHIINFLKLQKHNNEKTITYSPDFSDQVLNLLLAVYMIVHIPLDVYMHVSKDRSLQLKNYGVKDLEAVNAILGTTSTIFWTIWISNFAFGWIYSDTNFMELIKISNDSPFIQILQQIGIVMISLAVILAIWARISRGKHSSSWGLRDDYPLITTGPYRWIRHPTYTFYFLMFIGFPLFTLMWPQFILVVGIYGYIQTVKTEEQMLILHFGNEYLNYQKLTKKFIPFLW